MPAKTKKAAVPRHKHTKPYLKVYFPYLPLLAISFMIMALVAGSLRTAPDVLGASTNITRPSLLTATNQQRSTGEVTSLEEDILLDRAAQAKADDMATRGYWSHNTPESRTPWSFIEAVGYQYQLAGENLAYGFASGEEAVSGWMNSPAHRANLLNTSYADVGFGIASSDNYLGSGPTTIVVAMYASPAASTGLLGASSTAAEVPAVTISKVQLLTDGQAPWIGGLLLGAAASLGVFMAVRRNKRFLKLLKREEKAILAHPVVDITILAFIALTIILTRSAGIIR